MEKEISTVPGDEMRISTLPGDKIMDMSIGTVLIKGKEILPVHQIKEMKKLR